jgi:hypothetical protein
MHAHGEIVVTADLFRSAVRVAGRRSLIVLRVLGLLFALLGLYSLLAGGTDDVVFGITFIVVGLVFALVLPIRALSAAVKRSTPLFNEAWRYDINEHGLRIANPLVTSEWRWNAIVGFDEFRDFWLARTRLRGQSILVVKAAFPEADRRLIAELAVHLVQPRVVR